MTSLIMHFVDCMQRHAHYLCLYKQKRTSACVIKWKWLSFLKCMSLIFHTSNGIHFKDLNWQFHFYIKWHFNLWKVVHAHFCNWSIVDLHINIYYLKTILLDRRLMILDWPFIHLIPGDRWKGSQGTNWWFG